MLDSKDDSLLETLDSTDEAWVPVAAERAEEAALVIDDRSEEMEDEILLAALLALDKASIVVAEPAAVAREVATLTMPVVSTAYGRKVSQLIVELDGLGIERRTNAIEARAKTRALVNCILILDMGESNNLGK